MRTWIYSGPQNFVWEGPGFGFPVEIKVDGETRRNMTELFARSGGEFTVEEFRVPDASIEHQKIDHGSVHLVLCAGHYFWEGRLADSEEPWHTLPYPLTSALVEAEGGGA